MRGGGGGGGGPSSEKEGPTVAPKGCMVVRVGHEDSGEQQRFVVPISYLNHPLFVTLLKEAEEEYGFRHSGVLTIPCHVDYFRKIRGIIDRDYSSSSSDHNNHQFHLNLNLSGCFRA